MDPTTLTLDIYAYTNPAFTALILTEFSAHYPIYASKSKQLVGTALPLFFLAYPILFSEKGRKSFLGTNTSTGFFGWLDRHPEVRVDFAQEVRAGKPYVQNALLFAVDRGLLETDGWHFWPLNQPPWKKPAWKVKSDERGQMLFNARSLGVWMGRVNLPTIFQALGVGL